MTTLHGNRGYLLRHWNPIKILRIILYMYVTGKGNKDQLQYFLIKIGAGRRQGISEEFLV